MLITHVALVNERHGEEMHDGETESRKEARGRMSLRRHLGSRVALASCWLEVELLAGAKESESMLGIL